MSRDLEAEVNQVRKELEVGFQMARPTEKFRANMILATIELRVIAEQFKNSQESKERRKLEDDFERKKETVQKGIQMLFESARAQKTSPVSHRALP